MADKGADVTELREWTRIHVNRPVRISAYSAPELAADGAPAYICTGKVFAHAHFPNGMQICTTRVLREAGGQIETASGATYRLGAPYCAKAE